MKIAIVQTVTPEIAAYTKFTVGVNAQYCIEKGYDYHIVQNHLGMTRHPSWNRIVAVKRFLEDYDYVVVVDADAIVQNASKSIEDIIALAPSSCILVCDDTPNGGLINCGVMIFRNAPWTHDFLERWWDKGSELKFEWNFPYEQGTMKALLEDPNQWMELAQIGVIKILPINTFNSHWQVIPEDNFIAHIMARPIEGRVEILRDYFKRITKEW